MQSIKLAAASGNVCSRHVHALRGVCRGVNGRATARTARADSWHVRIRYAHAARPPRGAVSIQFPSPTHSPPQHSPGRYHPNSISHPFPTSTLTRPLPSKFHLSHLFLRSEFPPSPTPQHPTNGHCQEQMCQPGVPRHRLRRIPFIDGPGRPTETGRHGAHSRGCSTCRAHGSARRLHADMRYQVHAATSLPLPCTPKRGGGVRARAGGRSGYLVGCAGAGASALTAEGG